IKSLDEFYENKTVTNGHYITCKDCSKESMIKYKIEKIQKILIKDKLPKIKNCAKCKITKDLDEFPKIFKNSEARRSYCRDCTSDQYYDRKIKSPDYKPPTTGDEVKKKLADYLSRK